MNIKITTDWFYKKSINLDIHKRIYIAYSGGVDSSVLLHLTSNVFSSFLLKAIHVNHMYTKGSKKWSLFCKQQCDNYKIPIISFFLKKKENQKNLEEYFRIKRYKFFSDCIFKNSSLLLAHNKNDVLETILLKIFRGSSLHKFSGINEKIKLGNLNIIRPLLCINKMSILNYAKEKKINYIIDFSNFDRKFGRNYIRHDIIPLILKKWSMFINLAHSYKNIYNNSYRYIFYRCINFLKSDGFLCKILPINYLLSLPKFIRYEILRLWIRKNNYKLPFFSHLVEIDKIILSRNFSKPLLRIGIYTIKRSEKYLYIMKTKNDSKNIKKNLLSGFLFFLKTHFFYKKKDMKFNYLKFEQKIIKENFYVQIFNINVIIKYKKKIIIICGFWLLKSYNILYKSNFFLKFFN